MNRLKVVITRTALIVLLCAIPLAAQDILVNELMSANALTIEDEDGDYSDWIEIYNRSDDPVSIDGWRLSDDADEPFRWAFPALELESHQFLLIFASGKDRRDLNQQNLHTNFSISALGEVIILSDSDGETIDIIEFNHIPLDVSYGRRPDGEEDWCFFPQPTPGESNSDEGYQEVAEPPEFSEPGGFYQDEVTVTIEADDNDIYYTLDGSAPTRDSDSYDEPVVIDETTVLRARAGGEDQLLSSTVTNTYFIDEESTLPVVSLATDPDYFFDDEIGIYVMGNDAEDRYPFEGANFWEDWERPVHIEFFESDGELGFSMDAGVKIFGGATRWFPQKSLVVTARGRYGPSMIDYRIFPDLDIDQFKAVVLRNSGHDWNWTLFREGMINSLVKDEGISIRDYRPAIMFLNGEYWGIHNLREKMNVDYLVAHFNVDPENVDLIDGMEYHYFDTIMNGDSEHYDRMLGFIEENDMSDAEVYDSVKTMMDMDNFVRYQAIEIFINNTDWPGNNVKFWRQRDPGSRWRWFLFDIDFAYGGYRPYTYNTLDNATKVNGHHYSNLPWATFLLRSLLENQSFRNDFINQLAELMNFNFLPGPVIQRIDEMQEVVEPEVARHLNRWRNISMGTWRSKVELMRTFARRRADVMRGHIIEKFDLDTTALVRAEVDPEDGGTVSICSRLVSEFPWEGIYFEDIPIQLEAFPNNGYRFIGWTGDVEAEAPVISVDLQDTLQIIAAFEPDEGIGRVVINEINYHSPEDFDPGDWIELYSLEDDVNLADWMLRDEDDEHEFRFPGGTFISEGEYIVLTRDPDAFADRFPHVERVVGGMDFGLGGNDQVRLFNTLNVLVDSVAYDNEDPWPEEPDGQGPTLELIDPFLSNDEPDNWRASLLSHGSPGLANLPGSRIVINEINYHSAENFDSGDWIELYAVADDYDLDGWILRDQLVDHRFVFPEDVSLQEGGFLVVARDIEAFADHFPDVEDVVGGFDFDFGEYDQVRLYDADGVLIDLVAYSNQAPWPREADGGGPSVELIDPELPNEAPDNWRPSPMPHGSPGRDNFYHTPSPFALVSPGDRDTLHVDTVRVVWTLSTDPDQEEPVDYQVEWSPDENFETSYSADTQDTFLVITDIEAPNLRFHPLQGSGTIYRSVSDVADTYHPGFDVSARAVRYSRTKLADTSINSPPAERVGAGGGHFTAPNSHITPPVPRRDELPDDVTIYWRVKAVDLTGFEVWADPEEGSSFRVDVPQPPHPFDLVSPEDDAVCRSLDTLLVWEGTIDPDPYDEVHCDVWLDTLSDLSTRWMPADGDSIADTTLALEELTDDYTYYWTVRATDSNTPGTWAGDTLSFRIDHPETPYWVDIPFAVHVEDGELMTFTVAGSDPDDDELHITYSSDNLPEEAVFNDLGDGSGRFRWQTEEDDVGAYMATFTLSDGLFEVPGDVIITVGDVNRPPEWIDVPDSVEGDEDAVIQFAVAGEDPDDEDLDIDFASDNLPEAAEFTDNHDGTGRFRWQTTFDDEGEYDAMFTATDGEFQVTAEVTITVNHVNCPPEVIRPVEDLRFDEDSGPWEIADLDELFFDPDSGELTYSVRADDPVHTEIDEDTHLLSLNVPENFNHPELAVIVTADDGQGGERRASVRMVRSPISRGPAVGPVRQTRRVVESGRAFTAASSHWGRTELTPPRRDDTAEDAFLLVITPVNDPPQWVDIPPEYEASETEMVEFTLTALDVDLALEGDELLMVMIDDGGTSVRGAEFVQNGDSSATYTWHTGFDDEGIYTPRFRVEDRGGASADTSVRIAVDHTNHPPVITEPLPDQEFDEDHPELRVADLNDHFTDPDEGDSLQFEASAAESLTVRLADEGVLFITPEPDWNGVTWVIAQAGDGAAAVSDTFAVVVNPVNDPPEPFSLLTPEDNSEVDPEDYKVTFRWEATEDIDSDEITYSLLIYVTYEDVDTTVCRGNIEDTTFTVEHLDSLLIDLGVFVIEEYIRLELTWWVEASDGDSSAESNQRRILVVPVPRSVPVVDEDLPTEFSLSQNYPNPFNPSTRLDFALPGPSDVRLSVWDTSGRLLDMIMSGHLPAGRHTATWMARDIPTGVYLFTLDAGDTKMVTKGVLIR